jgi:trans-2,3-dihydro-3-hydroxyanthranilate isomerase
MPRKIKFEQVDVFTDKAFGGNQLAVFLSPGDLTKVQMQNVAREMNYSETTFVFPPKAEGADAKVRIFTPAEELPFAGHPTIGTAFVIVMKGKRKPPERLVLELGVGKVPVDIAYKGKKISMLTMHQPVPQFGSALQNRQQAAKAVSLGDEVIVGGGVVTNGLGVLIVEARTADDVRRARLNIDEAVKMSQRHGVVGIYLFARMEGKGPNVHARFFAPTLNVYEDPATGSASGSFGAYMARLLKFPARLKLVIEQGIEIERPSLITVEVNCERGDVHAVSVSGKVVSVGEGIIYLP